MRHPARSWCLGPACALLACRGARYISRPDHHGEHKLEEPIFVLQGFDIADLNNDLYPWLDIGHRLSKNIRPFLIQQAGHVASSAGCFIDLSGFIPWFDVPNDPSFPHRHGHGIHCSVLRQGEDIHCFDLRAERVVKHLPHVYAAEKP